MFNQTFFVIWTTLCFHISAGYFLDTDYLNHFVILSLLLLLLYTLSILLRLGYEGVKSKVKCFRDLLEPCTSPQHRLLRLLV